MILGNIFAFLLTSSRKYGNISAKEVMKMYKEIVRPALFILDTKKELPDYTKKPIVSPLHYGETIEINLVRGIEGETFINGKRFEYKEKNVFFIPPKYLHTSVYRKGGSCEGDMICAFHINLKELASVIHVENLLLKDNRTLLDLAFRCEDFDGIWETVQTILDENRTFMARTIDLLRLFEMISNQKSTDDPVVAYSKVATHLIEFVEENYASRLTVQSAADHFGYSKQYFCKWFKGETGVTFNEFLNTVRIHHARTCLASGYLVEEAAAQCGFSDPSYFTKVFKRFVGITPKAYVTKK